MEITIGFIGLGLIGGSIAKGIKRIHPEYKIMAYARNRTTLEDAKKENTIDFILDEINENISLCDIIYLCTPVAFNAQYLKAIKPFLSPTCIITDVGSVKGNIHKAVQELNMNPYFIGGHPMAGSEKTGYANSNAIILENAYYILTPSDQIEQHKIDFLYNLVKRIGSIPLIIDANEHDDVVAAISHVPHLIASSLVTMVKESDDPDEKMRLLAAGGFKDITRIASSSPIMWQNICLTNTESIRKFLECYISTLTRINRALSDCDETYLYDFFESAREYRDNIPTKKVGMLKQVYEVYLDIFDETGAIATIATILASNNISIKNIGINHNREFEEGVLRIELYDEESSMKAVTLLEKYRYTVYARK